MYKRKLDNWLDSWEEFVVNAPSSQLWKQWAGISTVAAALERKVWVTTGMGRLYPNLYIILCGPPGTGKTALTSKVHNFLARFQDPSEKGFHIASSSVTFASVIDELEEAKRDVIRMDLTPNRYQFNALTIISNELGVLLPEYDLYMMPKLTDLYDNHPFSERRRTGGKMIKIESPILNMLAACTPSYLMTTLPPGAWDQGFLARTLIAFSSETNIREIFGSYELDVKLQDNLADDLAAIFNSDITFGPMVFTPEARSALEMWHKNGGPPLPEHPKLMHYNTRRTTQIIKLCMVASVMESSDLIITQEHLARAMGWLIDLETYLPDVFKAIAAGGDGQAITETWYYFASEYTRDKRPVTERRVVEYLMQRVPSHSVVRCLDILVRSGMLQETVVGNVGKCYIPRERKRV